MPEALAEKLRRDFGYRPVIATEIEFYLPGAAARMKPAEILGKIEEQCEKHGIVLFSRQQERGLDQYEVALRHGNDLGAIIEKTETFKSLLKQAFASYGIQADFSAKPFSDQPGSGLHIHVHLEDADGNNVYVRQEDAFCPALLHSIGGLLALMNACMPIFAPTVESYLRFQAKSNAPTTLSWGTNNRTTALRLPNKPLDGKHIEHRVAGSDADVGQVVKAVLAGIHYGLSRTCDPGKPVYGDASLPQYGLPKLAMNMQEAAGYYDNLKDMLQVYGL